MTEIDRTTLLILGSVAVHAEELVEMLDRGDVEAAEFDKGAIRGLMGNPCVREWIESMGPMLPRKRTVAATKEKA